MASTLEGAIAELLGTAAAITAIIGTNEVKPQSDTTAVPRPKLTYWRWGTDRSTETGGITNDGATGFAVAKVFVDAWGDEMLTVKQLSEAARRLLHGFTGTVAGFQIGPIIVVDEREQPAAAIPGRQKPVQRQTLDLRVTFQES